MLRKAFFSTLWFMSCLLSGLNIQPFRYHIHLLLVLPNKLYIRKYN